MTRHRRILHRTIAGLVAAAVGVLAAAGAYTEANRVPGQP
jgi:hypothetical protein